MKTLNLTQGSPEWLEVRAKHFTASEAATMMSASKYMTRTGLLRQKVTGDILEVDAMKQALFDQGHHAEAKARPIAENIIGEELYPTTATDDDGYLLASFDGVTLTEGAIWEHKLWNVKLAEQVKSKDIGPAHYWQLEQQLLISGADACLFMTSDGTTDKCEHFYYKPVPGRVEQLLAGWKQFDEDLKSYQHVETKPEPVGRSPDALPALRIELNGMVTNSNLTEFTDHAMSVFGGINKDLRTDEDFASAEKTVKWCKEVEIKLAAAKQNALSQTSSIDELFRAIDSIKEEARAVRLYLEKLIASQKIAIRGGILEIGSSKISDHIAMINSTLGKLCMPDVAVDFAGAMKGKRTVASLQSAVDDELARAKIEASQIGDKMRINRATLVSESKGYEFLFVDGQQLALKDNDDLTNLIKTRIADHKKEEEEKARLAEEQEKAAPAVKLKYVPPFVGSDSTPATNTQPPAHKSRPSDAAIINQLSSYYNASQSEVIEWLLDMDLDKAIENIVT